MSKDWRIAPVWPQRESASAQWSVSPLLAQILYNRNIETLQAARSFLAPQLAGLHEPSQLPGAEAAAGLLADAVCRRRRIVIYGDYDVDGMTGAAILWHLLRMAGATVEVYVPHRIDEGYGINLPSLDKLRAEGTDVIVSVDCGVGSPEAARRAQELGLTLVITDHHVPPRELPECAAIVHPTALGPSPNPHLSGAGVAFKLAWMVALKLSQASKVTPQFRQFLLDALGLAALGTVADVVPLVGENRILAQHGLAGLPRSSLPGIRALIESAGLEGDEIDSYAVGFKLAPRLNAAGRLGHARLAVELLTRADAARSAEIARYLDHQNRARQTLERRLTEQACEMVELHHFHRDSCRAIVLAAEGWHAGVLGIVASRLVEQYHRPAVLIALSDGLGQGSARSIRHFELHHALDSCREHLLSFGGHSMAAGLRIESGRVEAFRNAFLECANNRLTPADLVPRLELDAEVGLGELDTPTVRSILRLGPFGSGNPRPRMASGWLSLVGEPRRVGKSQEHLQFAVSDGQATRKAIAFGQGKHLQALRDQRGCRVAFEPIINSFRGSQSVELQVADIKFGEGSD